MCVKVTLLSLLLSSPFFSLPQVPIQPGQSFKFTVLETLDRIKEEFQFLQAQYHSLKLECEKLASEKTEMQRHYIMVSSILFTPPHHLWFTGINKTTWRGKAL
uniref:Groucho/TLE N-terminal Q-rich domain-containing protein n=1 Tax=Hucho hucho TaxID=62062 RepID=A0A4W5RHB3_9TELE